MGRKYANSPIVEAVCEVRFDGDDWDSALFGLIWERVRKPFPQRREVRHLDVQLVPGPEGVQQKVTPQLRIRFVREDDQAFIQVGEGVVSVHHLAPYPTWEDFKPLILKGFDAYTAEVPAKGVHRLGLRYINRIGLPGPQVELDHYLHFVPSVGPHLPQDYGPFIVGVDIPFEDGRDGLRLQLASAQAEREKEIAVMLDLDYRTLKPGLPSVPQVPEWLELAHARVEDAFEGCVKDSLRAIFAEVR